LPLSYRILKSAKNYADRHPGVGITACDIVISFCQAELDAGNPDLNPSVFRPAKVNRLELIKALEQQLPSEIALEYAQRTLEDNR